MIGGTLKGDDWVVKGKANPKLEAVRSIITQVIGDCKVVIWYQYTNEWRLLKELLKKMKIKFCSMNGQVAKPHLENKRFQEQEKYRVMLAHPKSASEAIDLYAANYCIIYSQEPDPIYRRQLEKRIHRKPQKKSRCFFYDIVMANTIDGDAYRAMKAPKSFFEYIANKDHYKELRNEKRNTL